MWGESQALMELSNDYAYVILTIVGIVAVLFFVYRRQWGNREKEKGD